MKTIAKMAGALALLASSASMAASVIVSPSDSAPTPGSPFTITVHGDGFPSTAGATLALTFNSNVQVTSIGLAAGSPFTGGTVPSGTITPAGSFTSGSLISVLGPLVGTLPIGSFDVFTVTFQALSAGPANIVLVDDQSDICWSDAATFGCVTPVTYTQANVNVVPAPAAAWLIAPAVLAAGRFSRRRKAA